MAASTEESIEIQASPQSVMAVISEIESYPQWVLDLRDATVEATGPNGTPSVAKFVIEAAALKDTYVLKYDWAADGLSVSWNLISSILQKAQTGRYLLTPQGPTSTLVTYSLTVQMKIPLIAPLRRRAEARIVGAALADLKSRVEAISGS